SIGITVTKTVPISEEKFNLTSQQKEIVNSKANKILVLGGAGTGKTTTLIYKVYALIKDDRIEPSSILIVTFTKKAADDIKTRLEKLLGHNVRDLWLGTLHTICYRILKKEAPRLDFSEDFAILEDPCAVLKTLLTKSSPSKLHLISQQIEHWKTRLISPKSALANSENEWQKNCAQIYQQYQNYLQENNLMDFDDLIYYTARLLENPDLLKEYASKFNFVLVDELQDFTPAQYKIIQMLSSYHNRIFLTGDEDQSIYEWRGAHPEYVVEATRDFPKIQTFVLTQNFRVPQGIWRLATNLISKNKSYKAKPILLLKDEIENVELFSGDNEEDEVYLLTKMIRRQIEKANKTYADFAVLYRLNSQSRIYEEGLAKEKIPYSVIGAERFYEREEVKYLVDFLKAVLKSDITLALPTIAWLLGMKTDNLKLVHPTIQLRIKTKNQKTAKFIETINLIFKGELKLPVAEVLELILNQSGFIDRLKKDDSISAQNRLQNIFELLNAAKDFSLLELNQFLTHLLLLENLELVDWGKNTVKLMTVHSAKGLEFPIVFLAGMVEGVFPLLKNLNSPQTLAEERRLCFVAVTRAQERLYISYPKRLHHRPVDPSRFIAEMLGY
ncbi:MAG: UvrD-helicase domain-containing protein, partial [candidate division WOR-3 bacterium]